MALSISLSTLHRRKQAGRLSLAESDRAVRLAHLKDLALALMQGNNVAAINWLRRHVELFSGESPLQRADTLFGGRKVEDLIDRMRHGVFS